MNEADTRRNGMVDYEGGDLEYFLRLLLLCLDRVLQAAGWEGGHTEEEKEVEGKCKIMTFVTDLAGELN